MIIDKQKNTVLAIRKEGGCCSTIALELWTRYSIEVGNAGDLEVLRKCRMASRESGGFNWVETPQGGDFWLEVLRGYSPSMLDSIVDEVLNYIDFQHFN